MNEDDIRTQVHNVEGSTRRMRDAPSTYDWEEVRNTLRALTNRACRTLLETLRTSKPNPADHYICEVKLPENLGGDLNAIREQSKFEVKSVLRSYHFPLDNNNVTILPEYNADGFSVDIYPLRPSRMPSAGTFLFLTQGDHPVSGFPLNPADGSLGLSGSATQSRLSGQWHRYPLHLKGFEDSRWARFRTSEGRLEVYFLLQQADFRILTGQDAEMLGANDDWQTLPNHGTLRVSNGKRSVDIRFDYRQPSHPDVGRLIEFNIGGTSYPAYSRVEAKEEEYLKYYDCFNDRAADQVKKLFQRQNTRIKEINSETRAALSMNVLFEPISVAESISITELLAEMTSQTPQSTPETRLSPTVPRDDGSVVVSTQVVLTKMGRMEQMRDVSLARRLGDCESLLRPMAAALDIAHRYLCFHGDVKPDNVCRDPRFPKWLTLIDTESFSSPEITASSSATRLYADPGHIATIRDGFVPTPTELMKSDRIGFVAVVLATWIGRGNTTEVFKRGKPLAQSAAAVLPAVSGEQGAVLEVLDTSLTRTAEDNPDWCSQLLTEVEKALVDLRSPVKATSTGRYTADIRAILQVLYAANADSFLSDTTAELSRRVDERLKRVHEVRRIVSAIIIVAFLLMLFTIL